jgi:hypothetical protein
MSAVPAFQLTHRAKAVSTSECSASSSSSLDDATHGDCHKQAKHDDDHAASVFSRLKTLPRKPTVLAFLLFFVGIALVSVGFGRSFTDRKAGIALFMVGSLCFIPGSYYVYLIHGILAQWEGYDHSLLPVMDDQ